MNINKLRNRLRRHLVVLQDCASRISDGVDMLESDEGRYVEKQADFLAERLQMIRDEIKQARAASHVG